MDKRKLKLELIRQAEEKFRDVEKQLNELSNSLTKETKSTSGDKHETGRAMVHLEMEKLENQYVNWQKLTGIASQLEDKEHSKAQAGSLIQASNGWFYLSIGFGQIKFENEVIFCLAPNAPMAQQFLGLSKNEEFSFNGRTFKILSVS